MMEFPIFMEQLIKLKLESKSEKDSIKMNMRIEESILMAMAANEALVDKEYLMVSILFGQKINRGSEHDLLQK